MTILDPGARLKLTATLNAAELNAIPTPEGKPRVRLRIRLPDRTIAAEVAAKSLGKAQTAIREAGPGSISRVASGPGERHEQRMHEFRRFDGLTVWLRATKPTPR
jgi:hypothetical protein